MTLTDYIAPQCNAFDENISYDVLKLVNGGGG